MEKVTAAILVSAVGESHRSPQLYTRLPPHVAQLPEVHLGTNHEPLLTRGLDPHATTKPGYGYMIRRRGSTTSSRCISLREDSMNGQGKSVGRSSSYRMEIEFLFPVLLDRPVSRLAHVASLLYDCTLNTF
jgi:hypothetical protein